MKSNKRPYPADNCVSTTDSSTHLTNIFVFLAIYYLTNPNIIIIPKISST